MNANFSGHTLPVKRVRIAIFIFFFLQGLCFASWASRIPYIKSMLGMDDAAWGTILLMIPVGQLCGMALSGYLIPKLGSKLIQLMAILAYAATLIVIGWVQTQFGLLLCLVIFGFFGNFCNISVNTQAVTLEDYCGKPIMSSFHGGWSLAGLSGAAFGLMFSGFHIEPFYHFCLIGVIVLVAVVTNYKYLQPDPEHKIECDESGVKKKLKPEAFLYFLGFIGFCGMAAEGAMTDWQGVYLHDIVGVKQSLAPIGLAAYMITMASGRFVMDFITARLGRRFVLRACGGLIFIGLMISVVFPNLITTLLAFMVIGFGTAGIVPTVYSITGEKTKIHVGTALTIVSSISFLGYLSGPPVIGYISRATNLRYSYAFIGLFGIGIIVLSSLLQILKKR